MDTRDLVEVLGEAFDGVIAATTGLTNGDWALPTGCQGWTVKDHVSHVVGLELELMGHPRPDHVLPDGLDYIRSEAGRWMELAVDARRPVPGDHVLAELHDVVGDRMAQLRGLTDEQLAGDLPGPMGSSIPAHRMLGIRVFDVWAHDQDIRRATRRQGSLDTRPAAWSLRRMLAGLPYALGDAGLPPDRTIVVEVTGAQPAKVALRTSAGGVARADESEDVGTPDAVLTLDFADFAALACGRSDAPPPGSDRITVDGDPALAERLIAHLGMTP